MQLQARGPGAQVGRAANRAELESLRSKPLTSDQRVRATCNFKHAARARKSAVPRSKRF
jgi:hypothetical protein